MTVAIYDQILAEIQTIEADAALRAETNFIARAQAVDRIDALAIDENDLNRRAQNLIEEFASIDEQIYQRLRDDIRKGLIYGAALRDELARYCGTSHARRGYDALDVFVNGLLGRRVAPQATRALEPEMVFYQPTPARVMFDLIEMTPITAQDIFYDLGSGLGQVCLLVHLLTNARTRGIEFESAYGAYARESARQLNLANVEFIDGDARNENFADATIIFMYTPFTGAMLDQVLKKIERATHRDIRLCAYGECVRQIAEQTWLTVIDQRGENADALAIFARV